MDNHDHGCKKIGRRLGVLFAFFGAVAAALMLGVTGLHNVVGMLKLQPEVGVGLVVLFVAAAWLGTKAGLYLCRRGCTNGMHVIVGIGVAFGSITFSVLAGSFTFIVSGAAGGRMEGLDLWVVWFLPLLLVLIYGSIPAVILGILYGLQIKKELANMDYYV